MNRGTASRVKLIAAELAAIPLGGANEGPWGGGRGQRMELGRARPVFAEDPVEDGVRCD